VTCPFKEFIMSKYNTPNNNKYFQKNDVIQKNMQTSPALFKHVAQPIKTSTIQKNLQRMPVKNKYSDTSQEKFIFKKSVHIQKANLGNVAENVTRGLKEIERLKGMGRGVEDAWKQFAESYAPTPDMMTSMMKESPDYSLAFNEPWEVPQSTHQKISDLYDSIIPMTHTNPELSQGLFGIQEARRQGKSKRRALYDFMQTQPTPSLIPDIVERVGLTPKATAKLTDVYDKKYGFNSDDNAIQGSGLRYQTENPGPRQLFPKTVAETGFIPNPRSTLNDISIKDETYNTPLDITNIENPFMSKPMSNETFYQHFNAYDKPEPTDNDLKALEYALSGKSRRNSRPSLNELMASVYGTLAPNSLSLGYKVPETPDEFLPLMGDYPYLPAINERTGQSFVDSNTGAYANSNNALDPEFTNQYNPTGHPDDDPSNDYDDVIKILEENPEYRDDIELMRSEGMSAFSKDKLMQWAKEVLNRL